MLATFAKQMILRLYQWRILSTRQAYRLICQFKLWEA